MVSRFATTPTNAFFALPLQYRYLAASVLFTAGTLVQSLSTSFPIALVGRVLYGLGIGTAMHVAPLFIAETSPNDLRGRLVSFKEAAIVLGQALLCCVLSLRHPTPLSSRHRGGLWSRGLLRRVQQLARSLPECAALRDHDDRR